MCHDQPSEQANWMKLTCWGSSKAFCNKRMSNMSNYIQTTKIDKHIWHAYKRIHKQIYKHQKNVYNYTHTSTYYHMISYICICIYTWNPNDPCFDWKFGLLFEGSTRTNRFQVYICPNYNIHQPRFPWNSRRFPFQNATFWILLVDRSCEVSMKFDQYMGVSKNNGTSKSWILIGFSMK